MKKTLAVAGLLLSVAVSCSAQTAPPLRLQPNDLVGIAGDSITEQKQYSAYIEDYLLMCQPASPISAVQFGWSGETATHLLSRLNADVIPFHPTVITTCEGMNDGGYAPLTPDRAAGYKQSETQLVEQLKKAGVREIVIGSPGCVDSTAFRNSPDLAVMYNKTLDQLKDIGQGVAQAEGVDFADVHDIMYDTMGKLKAKYGDTYVFAGPDGVHPGPNGHLVMAYAFLKALGCPGDIGTITVDLAANTADATDGHKILSVQNGTVSVESTRYPFCFPGDPKAPQALAPVLEFLPFNQDLNRFMLVVHNAPSKNLKVTWGNTSNVYSADALDKGVNLTTDFLDNPFVAAFTKVDGLVRQQQAYETPLVKVLMDDGPMFKQMVPDDASLVDRLTSDGLAKDAPLRADAVAAVVPVQYTIKIEAAP